jgi:hypothetical protein
MIVKHATLLDYNTPVFANVVYRYIVAAIPYIELHCTSRNLKERAHLSTLLLQD